MLPKLPERSVVDIKYNFQPEQPTSSYPIKSFKLQLEFGSNFTGVTTSAIGVELTVTQETVLSDESAFKCLEYGFQDDGQ